MVHFLQQIWGKPSDVFFPFAQKYHNSHAIFIHILLIIFISIDMLNFVADIFYACMPNYR